MLTEDEKRTAHEAARILTSPLFREVFEKLDARYVENWRGAKTAEERERCWQRQACLQLHCWPYRADVQRELLGMVNDANCKAGGKDEGIKSALERAKRSLSWRKK